MENKKTGRKSKYDERVKPYLKDIQKWMDEGMTDKDIAKTLGIAYSTYREYKKIYPALSALVKDVNRERVIKIKDSLYKRAVGYNWSETKVTKQEITISKEHLSQETSNALEAAGIAAEELEIPATIVKTVVTTKHIAPDPGAALILLQHWAKDEEWTRDPQRLRLAKEEFAHRKKKDDERW